MHRAHVIDARLMWRAGRARKVMCKICCLSKTDSPRWNVQNVYIAGPMENMQSISKNIFRQKAGDGGTQDPRVPAAWLHMPPLACTGSPESARLRLGSRKKRRPHW